MPGRAAVIEIVQPRCATIQATDALGSTDDLMLQENTATEDRDARLSEFLLPQSRIEVACFNLGKVISDDLKPLVKFSSMCQ